MKIIRADHMGMCFGVRDAIALAKEHSASQKVTILGELVHNESVMGDLRKRGVTVAYVPEQLETSTVMITAHGASDKLIQTVRNRGHNVLEATCPLVHYAHRSLRKLVQQGFHPVVIGKRDHVEVRGLIGDFDECDVVLSEADIDQLTDRPKYGVISQTTQPIARVLQLVARLNNRFPNSEVRFIDTVCQPTKQRQNAATELAQKSDVVVVIGGANSNNTRELVATCERFCARVHHVQTAADLREEWFTGAHVVGLTAGTSTPDFIIEQVERALVQLTEPTFFAK